MPAYPYAGIPPGGLGVEAYTPGMTDTAARPRSVSAGIAWARAAASGLCTDLAPASGGTVEIAAPWTGEALHELRHATVRDVDAAEDAARGAQAAWAASSPEQRRGILFRAHDLLLARRRDVADLLQLETGKARGTAVEEIFAAASVLRHVAVTASGVLAPRRRPGLVPGISSVRVDHLPKGLVSVVTPWNFPLALAAMDVIPALAAGNAVLQKADDQAVLTVLTLRRALVDAGLPPAVWQVVTGPGDPVGDAVVDAGDHIAFTGSTRTGIRVAERAATRLAGVSLELGGKNPMIVLDDVDPATAARQAVTACFSSTGQLCVSIERIYVLEAVAADFLLAFAEATAALRLGGGLDHGADLGSLTSRAQLERTTAHIRDAVGKGAILVAGGRERPDLGPLFVEPAILANVTPDMDCFAEETFGPVVAVHVVRDEEEAIAAANDSEYGLNASVLAGSAARGRRVARRLLAGTVNVNEGYRAAFGAVGAPQGGMRRSGLGRRNGPEGILRFTQARTIAQPSPLVPLPDSGAAAARLEPVLMGALRVLRALRLP